MRHIITQDLVIDDFLKGKYQLITSSDEELIEADELLIEANEKFKKESILNNLYSIVAYILSNHKLEIEDMKEGFNDELIDYLQYITDENIESTPIENLISYINEYLQEELDI